MNETNPGTRGTDDPQGLVPPYDGKEDQPIQTDPISKSSGTGPPPEDNRTASYDDDDGLTDTDTNPKPVEGVGESSRRNAEEIADDTAEGHKGPSQRPYGGSDPDDSTSIDPHENATGGPNMPVGDQGG